MEIYLSYHMIRVFKNKKIGCYYEYLKTRKFIFYAVCFSIFDLSIILLR